MLLNQRSPKREGKYVHEIEHVSITEVKGGLKLHQKRIKKKRLSSKFKEKKLIFFIFLFSYSLFDWKSKIDFSKRILTGQNTLEQKHNKPTPNKMLQGRTLQHPTVPPCLLHRDGRERQRRYTRSLCQ